MTLKKAPIAKKHISITYEVYSKRYKYEISYNIIRHFIYDIKLMAV